MRRPLAACLIVLLLAGCGAPAKDGGDEDATAPTGTSGPAPGATGVAGNGTALPPPAANGTAPTLDLVDCTNFGGVFPVPMDAAQAALPDGFEPVPTPSDPAGGATLYVLWLDCAGSRVDGNDTGPTYVMYAELAVRPRDDARIDGVEDYTVPLAIGASADPVGQRLAEFRLGRAGVSTLSDVTDGSPGPLAVRMAVDGVTMDLRGQVSPQSGAAFGSGAFALVGVQEGALASVVYGEAEGGTPADAAVTFQGEGLDLFGQARPVVRGFSVAGFTLRFALAQSFP